MRLDEAQTGMIRKIKGNRGRATMDEKDYELLHALDETRNITHAADKLYMTQSALSKRIKALEQELGVEIVLRLSLIHI